MSEINDMDLKTLEKKLESFETELFEVKLKKHVSGLEKPHHIKEKKIQIARVKTAIRMKEER
jgi:ribosomal protein L29